MHYCKTRPHFLFPTFCRRVIESCAPDTPNWKAPGKDGCTKKECMERQGAFLKDRCRRDNMTYDIPPPWPKPDLPKWVWGGVVEFGRRQKGFKNSSSTYPAKEQEGGMHLLETLTSPDHFFFVACVPLTSYIAEAKRCLSLEQKHQVASSHSST